MFTAALSEALGEDGRCKTVYELDRYLSRRVPELCNAHLGMTQNPYTRAEPLSILDVVLVSDEKLAAWASGTPIGREIRSTLALGAATPSLRSNVYFAIDFGTSYSIISALDDSGKATFIPSARGKWLVPSVVNFYESLDYEVGWEALDRVRVGAGITIQGVKPPIRDRSSL